MAAFLLWHTNDKARRIVVNDAGTEAEALCERDMILSLAAHGEPNLTL